jgi:hypothetical protein
MQSQNGPAKLTEMMFDTGDETGRWEKRSLLGGENRDDQKMLVSTVFVAGRED